MRQKNDYDLFEKIELCTRYRKNGEMSKGGTGALELYKCGIAKALEGDKIDKKNYEYYYDYQKHYEPYEKEGLRLFEEAAKYFKCSAELGNDLAMMNYALYLFSFKGEEQESLKWFFTASDAGLAVADYQLSVFYRNGICGLEIDEEKAEQYHRQYKKRCEEDERQLILAWDVDDDVGVIARAYMFAWFCGLSAPLLHDTPRARESKWKYADSGSIKNKKRRFLNILRAFI